MWSRKPLRFVILALVTATFLIGVAYATGYSQPITETISSVSVGANPLQKITDGISTISVGQDHNPYQSTIESIWYVCANDTASTPLCTVQPIEYTALQGSLFSLVSLSGCDVSPAQVYGDNATYDFEVTPACQLISTLQSGFNFNSTLANYANTPSCSSYGTCSLVKLWYTSGAGIFRQVVTTFTTIFLRTAVVLSYNAPTTIGNVLTNWMVFMFVNFVPLAFFVTGAFLMLRYAKATDDRIYILTLDLVLTALYAMSLLNVAVPFFAWVVSLAYMFGGSKATDADKAAHGESQGDLA